MSYFFKFLQRQLVDDIDRVVAWYSVLVGHWKEYVRAFAAESAAFLLRKLALEAVLNQLYRNFGFADIHITEHCLSFFVCHG